MDEFLSEFHNLSGLTIDDKRRNLFRLLQQNATLSSSPQKLADLIANLKAATFLEQVFRAEVLIFFRRTPELFDEYKNGNEIVIGRVAKQRWFFQEALQNIEPRDFVNELLPTLSFSVKSKLVRKVWMGIGVREQICDEIFDALLERYGLEFASIILEKCSLSKIEETLKLYQSVKLTIKQLKGLFDKKPGLIHLYLEQTLRNKDLGGFDSLLVYIAQRDPEMFCKLRLKYGSCVVLGRKTTKIVLEWDKTTIINNSELFVNNLNHRSLGNHLGKQFRDFYFNLFLKQGSKDVPDVLKKQSKKTRFPLYENTFNTIFCRKFGKKDIDWQTLDIMCDAYERQPWAMLKFQSGPEESVGWYAKYLPPDLCFEILNDKWETASLPVKERFVQFMTCSCVLYNSGLNTFLKITSLVVSLLKSGSTVIDYYFLRILDNHESFLKQFEEKHWNIIEEVFACSVNKDWCMTELPDVILIYLCFLHRSGRPLKNAIEQYVHELEYYDYWFKKGDSSFLKTFLHEFVEVCGERYKNEETVINKYYCYIVDSCRKYNQRNHIDQINVFEFPELINALKFSITTNNCDALQSRAFAYVAFLDDANYKTEIEEIQQLFFENFGQVGTSESLYHFLKFRPNVVKKHFANVLKGVKRLNTNKVWTMIRKYSHLKLDEGAVNSCLQRLKETIENTSPLETETLVRPLSILLNSVDYADLTKSAQSSPNVTSKIAAFSKNIETLEKETLKMLVHNSPPTIVYSLILRKVPELKVKELLKASQGNHALALCCRSLNQKTAIAFLKSSSNPSRFKVLLKYFIRNPSDYLWRILKSSLLQDVPGRKYLLKTALKGDIPLPYRSEYFEAIWPFLSIEQKEKFLKATNIRGLSLEFCAKIFAETHISLEESTDFAARFLLFHDSPQKFDTIFAVVRKYFDEDRDEAENQLHAIVQHIVKQHEGQTEDFVASFTAKIQSYEITATIEDTISMNLLRLKGKEVEDMSKEVVDYNNLLVSLYGDSLVLNFFAPILKNWLHQTFWVKRGYSSDEFKFYYCMLTNRKSFYDALLVIQLLPIAKPETNDGLKLYNASMEILRGIPDKIVQLYLDDYLKKQCNPVKNA